MKGVIHVGAHNGEEVPGYQADGRLPIICFEPQHNCHPDPEILRGIHWIQAALTDTYGKATLNVPYHIEGHGFDTQSASLLRLIPERAIENGWTPTPCMYEIVTTWTFDQWAKQSDFIDGSCSLLKIDVQGAELQTLRGFGDHLSHFEEIVVECSYPAIYRGGADATEVIDYLGSFGLFRDTDFIPRHGDITFHKRDGKMKIGINIGCGQRRFSSTNEVGWLNVDSVIRDGMSYPDIVCDGARLTTVEDGHADLVVLHHVLEHFGCGEGAGLIKEAHRVLKPGGSLLVFVPDLRMLAHRYAEGGLSTQVYATNLYGAYMGSEEDRHKWGFDRDSLKEFLFSCAPWQAVGLFDYRPIPGAQLAQDWWIAAIEAVK